VTTKKRIKGRQKIEGQLL